MKKLLSNLFIIFILTCIILLSYGFLQNKLKSFKPRDIYHFFVGGNSSDNTPEDSSDFLDDPDEYRAVWLTYIEFNAYRTSVKTNNEKNFTRFYQHVLDRCKALHINHIIVQVRPFADALYRSDYYPWAECISGKQGQDPGYDPLEVMVRLTHENHMKIEAWINPYRISSGEDIHELADNNQARKWAENQAESRNVLKYDHALYYNPASKQVRNLIFNGVEEIVEGYRIDGIHMDDYFYPEFDETDFDKAFDAPEYLSWLKEDKASRNMSLADWRRYNINQLVSGIYKRVHKKDPSLTFGISPAGEPEMLRSNLAYYADIDTWVSKKGYIDYIMPQIYWGYTNKEAPFNDIINEWKKLCSGSSVKLYAGLQLYRLGITDKSQSDYKELQTADVTKKQLKQVSKDKKVDGFSLFSFQYLDAENDEYHFESSEYSNLRKNILKDVCSYIENK